MCCYELQQFHALEGIASYIQARTPGRDAVFSRMHCNNAPADTALARQTNFEGKLPCFIVKSTQQHDCLDTFCLARRHYFYLADRMRAEGREKQEQLSELATAKFERA